MNIRPSIAVLLTLVFPLFGYAQDWAWRAPFQVKQIALSTQLATFPLPQGEIQSVIGMAKLPHLGGSTDARGRVYGIVALTDPDSETGYYAVRLVYDMKKEVVKPEEIPILSAEVLYVSRVTGSFVSESGHSMTRLLPELKARMAEQKLTPIAFAESFYGLEEKGANQPPQRNAGSRPSSGDASASETPSSPGPRG
ncbi:MAG TPA: hypothetical protein VG734_23355 [Lacunisphaera sp.]|nr:hypothetical protein [Lacunisphaera sp.]